MLGFQCLSTFCSSVTLSLIMARDERGSRSSFEEEPEKQLGLLRSFVFVQNIVVEAKPLFLHRFFPNTKTVREEKGGTH